MILIPVDPLLEAQAADVLRKTGLTTETVVRILFAHLAEHGSMPAGLTPPEVAASLAAAGTDAILRAGRDRED